MAEASGEGLGALVGQLADGLATLVAQHIQLARVELEEEARKAGATLSRLALFIPFLWAGYVLVCAGAGVWIGRWLGLAGGLAAVGLVNVAGAGVGLARLRRTLKQQRGMGITVAELRRSAALLTQSQSRGEARAHP